MGSQEALCSPQTPRTDAKAPLGQGTLVARSEGLLGGLGGAGGPRKAPAEDPRAPSPPPQGNTVESEHLSELTEEEYEAHYVRRQDLKGFVWLDAKYLNPFFTRRLTQEDLHHGRIQMKTLTNKWYEEVRQGPSGSEDDEQELL